MVNRRSLRIKVMQTLYALHRCEEANFHLSIEGIREAYSPDLNSMEVQDKTQLNAEAEIAIKLFKDNYGSRTIPDKSYPDKVKDAVSLAKSSCKINIAKDQKFLKNRMILDIERLHDWYLLILVLVVEFARCVEVEIEESKGKLVEDTTFYSVNLLKNKALDAIKENNDFQRRCIKRDLNWDKEKSEVKQWFKTLVKKDETFIKYQSIENPTWTDDFDIVSHLIKTIILKDDIINSHISDRDSNWEENRHIAKGLLKKTLKKMGESHQLELMELSYSWDDDKEFFVDLFDKTVKNDKEYESLVSESAQNWDIERVAIVDKVLLKLAICEMINFPSIPVKVTINEFLELAKVYSTPKSKQFINGILDTLATELKANGKIKKSGRGLIDNK